MPKPQLPQAVLGTQELQEQFPNESQGDIRRYLAMARQRNLSRENTLWLVSYAGCVERAIRRLETAELPNRRPH